ncbi:MAG: sodium:proton antiporter [Caldilineae bacterium]|nr:MAG: sodium:proton antiporter [Caldilineae bacterium]
MFVVQSSSRLASHIRICRCRQVELSSSIEFVAVENLLSLEITVVELLLLVSVVAMLAQRIRVPYTVVLVLVGLLLSFQQELQFSLTPELILLLILPPLVFEAALHIEITTLRGIIVPVLLLAIPGVLLVMFIVGGILSLSGLVGWRTALLFGSLIAATDPVAVVSLFKALGAPKRLATLVESESLFNDGTTIVVFHIVVAVLFMTGSEQGGTGNLFDVMVYGVFQFLRVALGGVGIGVAVGIIGNRIFALLDDHLIETTLSTVIAYGIYVFAESFHLSGVLAVVSAGILIGARSSGSMSPTTRTVLMNFWEYVAFLANSIVFILIGMEVVFDRLVAASLPILVAVVAVLLARAMSVYALSFLSNRIGERVPISYQHILFWGGLRGAVSLALALSLGFDIPHRDVIINMTFGVVLFTLLVQATTINGLLARLGLAGRHKAELEYERIQGRLLAVRAAYQRLRQQYDSGILDPLAWNIVKNELEARMSALQQELDDFAAANPEILAKIIHSAQREALRTQRAAIMDLHRDGLLSESVAHQLFAEIDQALESPAAPEAGLTSA